MTAQIPDTYTYDGKKYDIVAMNNPIGFDPKDYGLEPHSSSTACWRGYWCEYAIKNGRLVLEKLLLYNSDGNYPPFNGINVLPQEFEEQECWSLDEEEPHMETFPKNDGHRTYEVNMKINYTGKIVLGDEFMREFYIHMGFQRPWAYKVLKEFDFVNGKLTSIIDHSEMARELRKRIQEDPEAFEKNMRWNIPVFIEESFSLDFADKAWWI